MIKRFAQLDTARFWDDNDIGRIGGGVRKRTHKYAGSVLACGVTFNIQAVVVVDVQHTINIVDISFTFI